MERKLFRFWSVAMILLIILISVPTESDAQQITPKKVSFTVGSGVTYGSAGDGAIGRLAGNFNTPSFRKQIYTGSFQYAFSRAWSLDIGFQSGKFTNQYDFDPAYENDFFSVTVKGITNMNGLFNVNSRFLNPYLSFGLGMIRSQLESEDLNSEDLSLLATAGAGMNFYLFRGADLFIQYDYNAAGSDLLDGLAGSGSSDQFASVTGGIRINFGSGGGKLASWPPARERTTITPQPEEAEVEDEPLTRTEAEPVQEPTEEQLMEREKREQELRERIDQAEDAMMQKREEARIFADNWREEQRIKEMEAQVNRFYTDQPEPGHYVQVYSLLNRENAETTRQKLVELLEGDIDDPSDKVLIHRFDDFNRVIIGPFPQYREANRVMQLMISDYEESFIITFPRSAE
ncbi:SPOR domain-containing protein [Rhodohalobacter barkolensis]|uniref:SPOR domain-containing protein n=1 Tax=Rhodohalobacter barkolensis TaxID=2053187 RepID=A0A2N0VIB2_9BACT|nr:SPOR domain-containing protein [Rhodohalobacter barkolensis]PKD43935.1 hypothetical protein CWD77_00180 [Rhodohalobacter barkolensis]